MGTQTLRNLESKSELDGQLQALLLEDDEEFVEAAYLALLQRRPDATGGRAYLRQLRNGANKIQVLFELANSNESRRLGATLPGLGEACAREGIGVQVEAPEIGPPEEVVNISRGEQLLVHDDFGKLIEAAYWVLLKRAPDPEGVAIYLEKLQGKTSKTKFLHDIFTSPECRKLRVELPGLREMFARENLPVPEAAALSTESSAQDAMSNTENAATELKVLMSLHGMDFVTCAYQALLDLPVEPSDVQLHTNQLMAGTSKIQILSEMVAAAGLHSKRDLPGLSQALKQFKLSRLPILGIFFTRLLNVEGDSLLERRSRAVEQRQIMFESGCVVKLAELGAEIDGLKAADEKAAAASKLIAERIASLESSAVILRQFVQEADRRRAPTYDGPTDSPPKSVGGFVVELRALEIARDLKRKRQ